MAASTVACLPVRRDRLRIQGARLPPTRLVACRRRGPATSTTLLRPAGRGACSAEPCRRRGRDHDRTAPQLGEHRPRRGVQRARRHDHQTAVAQALRERGDQLLTESLGRCPGALEHGRLLSGAEASSCQPDQREAQPLELFLERLGRSKLVAGEASAG